MAIRSIERTCKIKDTNFNHEEKLRTATYRDFPFNLFSFKMCVLLSKFNILTLYYKDKMI